MLRDPTGGTSDREVAEHSQPEMGIITETMIGMGTIETLVIEMGTTETLLIEMGTTETSVGTMMKGKGPWRKLRSF